MRWRGQDESGNIEDRRGMSVGRIGGIGGIGAVVVALIAIYFGQDPSAVLDSLNQGGASTESNGPYQESVPEADARKLIAVVLRDTERTWPSLLQANGVQYVEPHLVLFRDAVRSACGTAQSAVGPFYCSEDSKVYLDLTFFDELSRRFGAPGDFARAYVVAHEVGHHVQNLLGTSERVHRSQSHGGEAAANSESVRLELQADCYAGIWAHYADQSRHMIEAGDIEGGLAAASAIGDDKLQMQARGYVAPESFTHGTSAQRVRWFKRGYESGQLTGCDTFAASSSKSL